MYNGFGAGLFPRFPVHEENTMIDEVATFEKYGYYSTNLKPKAGKRVVAVCDGVEWKLIPLCIHCHPGTHKDPTKSRIEYLLSIEDM